MNGKRMCTEKHGFYLFYPCYLCLSASHFMTYNAIVARAAEGSNGRFPI